jgi:hypothetical protein
MEKRVPHMTMNRKRPSLRESRQGLFIGNGIRGAVSEPTYGHTPDMLRNQQEEDRKHREELAQIGRNVIG